jgi:predicted hotdog family 3-hydroxylacyl-ACP dehydratase
MMRTQQTRPTLPDITSLVPHSGTMLLLDRLVTVGHDSLQAEVTITPHSLFAGPQGVGNWIGIEYMAQAVAAFAGYEARYPAARQAGAKVEVEVEVEAAVTTWQPPPPKIGFLLGSRHYIAHCGHFVLGSRLQIHVQRLFQADNGLGSFDCFIEDGTQRLASATLTVFQPPNLQHFLDTNTA